MSARKLNCWEYKKCGRGPEGDIPMECLCPAATYTELNGVHEGQNSGRACWVVASTLGVPPCLSSAGSCFTCAFYKLVQLEEQQTDLGFSATLLGMRQHLRIIKQRQQIFGSPVMPIRIKKSSAAYNNDVKSEIKIAINRILGEQQASSFIDEFDSAKNDRESLIAVADQVKYMAMFLHNKEIANILREGIARIIDKHFQNATSLM